MTERKVQLTVTDGFSRLGGHDEDGNRFLQFTVDYFAEQEDAECARCGTIVSSGWACMDGGEEYCDDCVDVVADTREECEKRVTSSLA